MNDQFFEIFVKSIHFAVRTLSKFVWYVAIGVFYSQPSACRKVHTEKTRKTPKPGKLLGKHKTVN